MGETILSDAAIIYTCLDRSENRLVEVAKKHYGMDLFQWELEEATIAKVHDIAEEAGISEDSRDRAVAIVKSDRMPYHPMKSTKRSKKQENQELQQLCTSISKHHNLPFNGEPKEFLIQLELAMHQHPTLRENEPVKAVYRELLSIFPEISEAVQAEIMIWPPV